MNEYTREELVAALNVVSSTITNCEKMQLKFAEGTSHHTLLKNRLKAMYISKALMTNEDISGEYSKEDLLEALRPIDSVISKCEKGQLKLAVGTAPHTRFKNLIDAMSISKILILNEINKCEK